MKTVVTYKKLLQLKTFASSVANLKDVDDTVVVVKLQKLAKKACKPLEDFEEMVEDLRLDHCFKDGGKIVRDSNGQYQWSAEGEKAFRKAYKDLLNQEVETHYDSPISYDEFLKILPDEKSKALNNWEDMGEVLSPFFVEK
jgi:hypothetical protein